MSAASKRPGRGRAGPGGSLDARSAAVTVLEDVLVQGRSLATARVLIDERLDPRERALAMELVNGVLRWRFRLDALLSGMMKRPLRKKDMDLHLLLMVALYELVELRTPDYAVVNEAVARTRQRGKKWAAAMVNAVLRNFIRDPGRLQTTLEQDLVARYAHPRWLIEAFSRDWPDAIERIVAPNNQRPPMWLRVNRRRISVEACTQQLAAAQVTATRHPLAETALRLDSALDVSRLPGFEEGQVSVQDASAQLAAGLLGAAETDRVLDVCAAPGGKTCHVLESADVDMTAVDIDSPRMEKIQQNLDRLGLNARLIVGDATDIDSWWDGRLFDRILVDAPCSASGVIRRHPDIKSLRQPDDLASLTGVQQQILRQSWRMLKPGGLLLYVTCSILRQENERQIERLLSKQSDARELRIDAGWGLACRHGRQLLPGDMDGDGFYYARLKKQGIDT